MSRSPATSRPSRARHGSTSRCPCRSPVRRSGGGTSSATVSLQVEAQQSGAGQSLFADTAAPTQFYQDNTPVQLGIEYNPAPPFNAGSPETAPASVVATLKERMAPSQARRIEMAKRAAARLI